MAASRPSLGAYQLKQTFPALASLPFLAPISEVSLQDAFDWLKAHPTAVLSTAGSAAYYIWRAYQKRISAGTVLELDLEEQTIEEATSPLNEIIGLDKKLTLFGIIDALEHAANDKRIAGLLVRLGNVRLGFAQAQELHAAILRFRQRSGKKAIAYAEVFGEGRPSVVNFYIASAFDLIYMMPVGDVTLTGIWLNSPFFKNTLDKMGLEADVERRREHKSALNVILYDKFTPEHRAQIEHLVGGLLAQLCQGIADGRRVSVATMEALMAEGPYSAQEALEKKLVDGLAYRDQLYDEVLPQVFGKKPPLLFFSSYVSRVKSAWSRGPVVALITAHGMITRGKSTLMDEDGIKSDTMAAAIRSAANDKGVKAILLRVDSGGGSYYASDVIAREVINAKRKGKKVVVSMGNVAASGGYFISQNADAILVSPGTITGSIGVIYGKFIVSGLAEKLGITFDQYEWHGKKARAFSGLHHWTEEERREVARFIDRMYADFKAKVAEGRRIPVEAVEELAQGKVWLGAAAVSSRLADRTGGLYDAIGAAKELLGAASVTVKRWPGKGKVLKTLLDPPKNSEEVSYASPFGAVLNVFRLLTFVGTVLPRRLVAAVLHSTPGAALSADAALINAVDDQQ